MIRERTSQNLHVALLAVAMLAAVLLLAACAPSLPSDPPGVTGLVTRIAPGDGRPASFLVESTGTPPAGSISDKAQVTIPPSTLFFDSEGKAASLESIGAIDIGTKVSVWFEGPIAESYPVQGSAKAVQILGR